MVPDWLERSTEWSGKNTFSSSAVLLYFVERQVPQVAAITMIVLTMTMLMMTECFWSAWKKVKTEEAQKLDGRCWILGRWYWQNSFFYKPPLATKKPGPFGHFEWTMKQRHFEMVLSYHIRVHRHKRSKSNSVCWMYFESKNCAYHVKRTEKHVPYLSVYIYTLLLYVYVRMAPLKYYGFYTSVFSRLVQLANAPPSKLASLNCVLRCVP